MNANEAREQSCKLSSDILDIAMRNIRSSAKRWDNGVVIAYLEGSNLDKQSKLLKEHLVGMGFDVDIKIVKYLWIDFGFREMHISWA